MFDNWTYLEWLILVIDGLAVILVVRFLSSKVKKKLHEVELRQNHQTRQRREQAKQRSKSLDEE